MINRMTTAYTQVLQKAEKLMAPGYVELDFNTFEKPMVMNDRTKLKAPLWYLGFLGALTAELAGDRLNSDIMIHVNLADGRTDFQHLFLNGEAVEPNDVSIPSMAAVSFGFRIDAVTDDIRAFFNPSTGEFLITAFKDGELQFFRNLGAAVQDATPRPSKPMSKKARKRAAQKAAA